MNFEISNNKIVNIDYLTDKISKKIILPKKTIKIEELESIPIFGEYDLLLKYRYNINQLKQIAKEHKLKISGNKNQLISRIYSYLYLSYTTVKIQKIIRGYLIRKYNNIRGPAFKDRSLCTNNYDFLSMDELISISDEQFFSFKDDDGFIYGFDVLSLHNLINKSNGIVKNPFNTKEIKTNIIENFKTFLRVSKVLKINLLTEILDLTTQVSDKKIIELRALTLFQNIDSLGNYSNAQWFLTLDRNKLIKFIKELIDIWQYRANLTNNTKREICHPSGNPFDILPNYRILQTLENLDDIRKIILGVMEKLVNTGVNRDSKCLGAYYVLGAITLVNNDAATSLPWLFEATYHM